DRIEGICPPQLLMPNALRLGYASGAGRQARRFRSADPYNTICHTYVSNTANCLTKLRMWLPDGESCVMLFPGERTPSTDGGGSITNRPEGYEVKRALPRFPGGCRP